MEKSFELYDGSVLLTFDEAKHRYTARRVSDPPPGRWVPSVTGITGILDNDKSGRLQGWAVKMAAEYVENALVVNRDGAFLRGDSGQLAALDEVTKRTLITGMKGAHRRRTQAAADVGTMAHSWVEQWIGWRLKQGPKPERPTNEMLLSAAQAFLAWEKQHSVEYVFSERKVVSLTDFYAGTVDIVARVDGRLCVVDIKTSNFINEEFWLQTAAYAHALMEEFEEDIEDRWIVRLGKEDGKFDPHLASTEVDENGRARPTYAEDIATFLALRKVYAWAKRESVQRPTKPAVKKPARKKGAR